MKYITTIAGREFEVEIVDDDHVVVDGVTYAVDFNSIGDQPVYSMIVDGNSYEAYVYPEEEGWQVLLHGRLFPITVEDEREKRLRAASGGAIAQRGEFHLKAPMPGLVVAVSVEEGQEVKKGDVLVVLESMKMQNELKAPREGVVTRVRVQVGDSVDQRQTLLSVE
jgi:biotin carboxyl carrier protein